MEEETSVSAQSQYEDLLSKVKAMEPHLKLLLRDYRLITTRRIQFTYAVDFYDIWNYAESLARFMSEDKMRQVNFSDDTAFIRQIARAKLFFGLGANSSCVLLPPYVIELNNKIERVKERIIRHGIRDINSDFRYRLGKLVNKKIIQEAMSEFAKNGEIKSDLLEETRIFLEKYVKELMFLISGMANQGLDTLYNILSGENPRVKTLFLKWPELEKVILKVMRENSSEWNKLFERIRPNPESSSSNLNDAKAVDLVININDHLRGKGELLILVSGALAMKRVFKSQINNLPPNYISTKVDGVCIELPDFTDGIPLFRPIETFYYLSLFSEDTDESILERLGVELDLVHQVYMLGESIKALRPTCPDCVKQQKTVCTFSDGCHSIHLYRKLTELKDHFDEYERVLLAENRLSVIEPAQERIVAQRNHLGSTLDKTVFTLIEYLSDYRNSLDDNLNKREDALQKAMDKQIRSAFHSITDLTLYQNEIGRGLEKYTRTRYRIHFKNKEIEGLLNDVEHARDSGDVNLISQSIKKLLDRAYEETEKSEKQLLWAVLLLCHRLPNRTIEIAERTLDTITLENENEFQYIISLARFIKCEYIKVVKDCKVNIRKYPNDPRFYHLCGLAIGMQVANTTNASNDVSWSKAIMYEKDALALIEKDRIKDESFLNAVLNNLAYFHARRNESKDIEQAVTYIEQLENYSPSFDKQPEFINTRGWIKEMLVFSQINEEKKKDYGHQALRDFRQALEVARKIGVDQSELDEYQKDLLEAKQRLRDIVSLNED
jgi:hypothetical protein